MTDNGALGKYSLEVYRDSHLTRKQRDKRYDFSHLRTEPSMPNIVSDAGDQSVLVSSVKSRDVKTVYFSEPVCRNRFFTGYRLRKGLL